MLAFLLVAHAALGAALILSRPLIAADRSRLVRGAGLLGAVLAVGLFLARDSGSTWGSLTLEPNRAVVVASAIFCGWMLLAATDQGQGRWDVGALVGASSTALGMFALADWVAPALLFWVCLSGAALVASRNGAAGSVGAVVGLSDVLVLGALMTWALQEESWQMPDRLEGWLLYLAIGGVVLRGGLLPRIGLWGLAGGPAVALVPLLVGSVFALVPSLSAGDEVAIALPFLLVGVLTAVWCVVRSPQVVLAAGWAVATMLSLVWVAPDALGKAAAAALLSAGAILLWPWAGGRAGAERGLVLSAVPLTVGFGAILTAAVVSFERATSADTVLASAPWSAFAALLPAALAAGVTLGAGLGRRVEPETYRPDAVLATWGLCGLALFLGLSGGAELGFSLDEDLWLYVVAAIAAGVAARFAPRQPTHIDLMHSAPPLGHLQGPAVTSDVTRVAGIAFVAAAFVAVIWFTYSGLRVGFL